MAYSQKNNYIQLSSIEDILLNTLMFDFPERPVRFYFTRKDRRDIALTPLSHQLFPANICEIYPDISNGEKIYTSFTREIDGFDALDIDFSDRLNFSLIKRYYNREIRLYFQRLNMVADTTFVGDTQVWIRTSPPKKNKIAGCLYYDRFTIKVNYNYGYRKPELVISYDRPAKVLPKSISKFIDEYNAQNSDPFGEMKVNPVSLINKVLAYRIIDNDVSKKRFYITRYDKLQTRYEDGEDINFSIVYPIVNNKLASYLGYDDDDSEDSPFAKNRYKTYIPKIKEFKDKHLLTDNFRRIIPVVNSFTKVDTGQVSPKSKDLIYGKKGNGEHITGFIPRRGTNDGPFAKPIFKDIKVMLIAHVDHKEIAMNLGDILKCKNGKYGYYTGLETYLGLKFTYEKGLLFNSPDPTMEIKEQLKNKQFDPNVKYIAIYLTPISKSAGDVKQKRVYYALKELLLQYDIALQCIEVEKMIEQLNKDKSKGTYNFGFTLQNMSIAINAKLGGIPWKLNISPKHELVVGVGAFKDDKVQYIGSAFSFDNTGCFNSFEYFHKDELLELAGSIQEAIRNFKNTIEIPSRVIIHYYKDMREDEVEAIENSLYELDLGDIPIYVVTINKTESEDIIIFDEASPDMMPYSGRFVNLGNGTFLLCNNTRYENYQGKPDSYPFPVKLKIRCPNAPETLNQTVITGLIDQVYQFSRIYWKSVAQQNLPVTIKYPEMVAQIAPHFQDSNVLEGIGKDSLWFL